MERKKLPCDGGAVGSMGEAMRCASTNFTNSTTVVVPAPTVTMLAKPPAVSSNEYYFFEFGASPPPPTTQMQYFVHDDTQSSCDVVFKRDYENVGKQAPMTTDGLTDVTRVCSGSGICKSKQLVMCARAVHKSTSANSEWARHQWLFQRHAPGCRAPVLPSASTETA